MNKNWTRICLKYTKSLRKHTDIMPYFSSAYTGILHGVASLPLKSVCTIRTTFRETPHFPSRLTDIHYGRNPHKFKLVDNAKSKVCHTYLTYTVTYVIRTACKFTNKIPITFLALSGFMNLQIINKLFQFPSNK